MLLQTVRPRASTANDAEFGGMNRSVTASVADEIGADEDYDEEDEEDDEFEDGYEEEGADATEELPPIPDDNAPIVPQALMQALAPGAAIEWQNHSASPVVLTLLERRGAKPGRHRDLVEYHMAGAFLDCLTILIRGSYFVKFAARNAPPKDRFVRIEMIPDKFGRLEPFFCWYIHKDAVQMIDRVRLEDIVGLSRDASCVAFRRQMVRNGVVKGSYVGQHRARLSTKGAFTVWCYNRATRQPRSLSLLTTNSNAFEVWALAIEGVLALNSVCVGPHTNAVQDMQRLFDLAQRQVNDGEGADED
jgi:hypothetical protein